MTVRKQVLEYIRAQRAVSAQDIARAMKMSDANARHHLRILEANGVIEVSGERPAVDRGRPAKIYSIRTVEAGETLTRFLELILDEILDLGDIELQNQVLRKLAERMIEESDVIEAVNIQDSDKRINLTQRLNRLINNLNAMHYRARWEARPDSPQIILGLCPFYSIINNHPELCRFDQYMIETLLGREVEQHVKLGLDGMGNRICVFKLVIKNVSGLM